METNGETKELEPLQKISVSISVFQKYFKDLVVDSEKSIIKAESLQKQVKAIKILAESSTEIEWKEKKTAYEDSREETEKKKKKYYEIRDKRKAFKEACTAIKDGITKKIKDFRAECVQKAEAEKARIAKELREKEEEEEVRRVETEKEKADEERIAEEQRKINEQKEIIDVENTPNIGNSCKVCGGLGEIMESADELAEQIPCPSCNTQQSKPQENKDESKLPEYSIKETESDADVEHRHVHMVPPQKSEQGQNGPVLQEIEITITDFSKFIRACVMEVDGASLDLLIPDAEAIIELTRKKGCKSGDVVVPGCEVKG